MRRPEKYQLLGFFFLSVGGFPYRPSVYEPGRRPTIDRRLLFVCFVRAPGVTNLGICYGGAAHGAAFCLGWRDCPARAEPAAVNGAPRPREGSKHIGGHRVRTAFSGPSEGS